MRVNFTTVLFLTLIILYFFTNLAFFFFGHIGFIYVNYAIGIVFLLIKINRIGFYGYIYLIMTIFSGTVTILHNDYIAGYNFIPMVFSSIGVAAYLVDLRLSSAKFLFSFVSLVYWLYCIFIFQYYFFVDFDLSSTLHQSPNHISVFMIAWLAFLFLIGKKVGKELGFSYYLSFFILILMSGSISGIFTAFMILVFYCYNRFGLTKSFVVAAFVLLLIFSNFEMLIDTFPIIEAKFSQKIERENTDIRWDIYKYYFNNVSISQLIFGGPTESMLWSIYSPSLNKYIESYNLHSSYLLLLAKFGLPLSLFFILLIIYPVMRGFKTHPAESIFLLAIMVRAFSDTVFFSLGSFNWIVFFLTFSILRHHYPSRSR